MKMTKNAQNKKKGEKRTFRVNEYEDKDIIKYLDKASNGSGFTKEALRFYIMAIEKGITESDYLKKPEDKWGATFDLMKKKKEKEILAKADKIFGEDDDMKIDLFKDENKNNDGMVIGINEFDYKEQKTITTKADDRAIIELDLDVDFDCEF